MFVLFAGWSDFGAAMMTVVCLVGAVIVGFYVLSYAAHCVVIVVEQTAAGAGEVRWPDEPITDWISRSVFLGGLLGVWLAPAGILARTLRDSWLPNDPGLRFLILAIPGLWLMFPVGLLSALSANSLWVMFRMTVVGGMVRMAHFTIFFYLLTAVLAALTAAPWYFAVFRNKAPLLLVAAPLAAAGVLIYCRLVGRLGLVLRRLNPEKEEGDRPPKKKKPRADAPADEPPTKESERVESVQGWGLVEEEEKAPPKDRPLWDDEEDIDARVPVADRPAYDMADTAPPTPEYRPIEDYHIEEMGPQSPDAPRAAGRSVPAAKEEPQRKPRRNPRPKPPPGPRFPLLTGVFTFPWYPATLGSWLWLSLGFLVFGLLCAGVVNFYPTGE